MARKIWSSVQTQRQSSVIVFRPQTVTSTANDECSRAQFSSSHMDADTTEPQSCSAGLPPTTNNTNLTATITGSGILPDAASDSQTGNTEIALECRLCKMPFAREQAHQRHMKLRHSSQSRFKCPFPKCDESFGTQMHLERHTGIVHPDETANEHMPRSAGSIGQSSQVKYMHSNQASHPNIECPTSTCSKTLGQLALHANAVHTKENGFQCKQCSKKFSSPYNLKRHMVNLHKNQPFLRT